MKKLIVAAAAVAMIGVAQAACEKVDCAYVYKLVMNGKSTKAVALNETVGCEKGDTCYRQIASIRWVGFLVGQAPKDNDCCDCNKFETFNSKLWNAKNGDLLAIDQLKLDFVNVLRRSGAKDKAEICWTLKDNCKLAGFAKINKESFLKEAHGFFAGSVPPPECCTCTDAQAEECVAACYFELCDLSTKANTNETVAYGRWSLKYSAVRSAKVAGGSADIDSLAPAGWEKTTALWE